MRTINSLRSRPKDTPATWLDGSLNDALQLVELLRRCPPATTEDALLVELETAFDRDSEALQLRAGDGDGLPGFWEELVDVGAGVRTVFQLLLIYATWRRVLVTCRSFQGFLEAQGRLLENARESVLQCAGSREYCRELLRSAQHDLAELKRLCLRGIATIGAEGRSAQQALRLLELFDELAGADAELLDCLEELYAAFCP